MSNSVNLLQCCYFYRKTSLYCLVVLLIHDAYSCFTGFTRPLGVTSWRRKVQCVVSSPFLAITPTLVQTEISQQLFPVRTFMSQIHLPVTGWSDRKWLLRGSRFLHLLWKTNHSLIIRNSHHPLCALFLLLTGKCLDEMDKYGKNSNLVNTHMMDTVSTG